MEDRETEGKAVFGWFGVLLPKGDSGYIQVEKVVAGSAQYERDGACIVAGAVG